MTVRHRRNILDLVQNFDLTFCQTWYDGNDVWSTHPDHIRDLKGELQGEYIPIYMTGNFFLRNRIGKYNDRGFSIAIPDIKVDRLYLAQLVLLERGDQPQRSQDGSCNLHFKSNIPGIEPEVAWARKFLFRIAVGTWGKYINNGLGSTYLKEEDGYDSDDYIEDRNKVFAIKDKDAMREDALTTLQLLREMFQGWDDENSAYVAKLNDEIEQIYDNIDEIKEPKIWMGWTKNDAIFLDSVFDEKKHPEGLGQPFETEFLISMCPVCLKFDYHEPRTCMYMSHKCTLSRGRYYDKILYSKFFKQGKLSWCVHCGRICEGHQHCSLVKYDNMDDAVAGNRGGYFDADCRTRSGGGGPPEKIARLIAMRRKAKELNEKIGQITEDEAHAELIKATWDGPFTVSKEDVDKVMEEKKFNVSLNVFRSEDREEYGDVQYPDASNTDLMPIVYPKETEQFKNHYDVDDENIIQFRHKIADGTVNNHNGPGEQISRSMFVNYLNSLNDQKDADKFGHCWMYPTCTARLYPEEVLSVIDQTNADEMNTYKRYKDEFNYKFRAQKGGYRKTRKTKRVLKRGTRVARVARGKK